MHDREAMQNIVAQLYATMILQQHGSQGVQVLKQLLKSLHRIYDQVPPETQSERFLVFKTLDDTSRPLPVAGAMRVRRMENLAQDLVGPAILQLLDNGEMLLWKQHLMTPIAELAATAIVYEYDNAMERFYAKNEVRVVEKWYEGCLSVFAIPTFSKLREALEHYRAVLARHSVCEILARAWHDSKRLFFREKPEIYMRKSLTQFLVSSLRGTEPRPEQIVDETHPVDIKVTFMHTNRLALIEIKWLGKSVHSDGAVSTEYSAVRARDGAKQLAEYLDANKARAPKHRTRGYLVVYDGRRRGTKPNDKSIKRTQGFHYLNEEISYDPAYHQLRDDFEEPVRLFLEPVCDV
ncbi:hypothetical protein [Nannocystis sp.]|uniref:hypothetical protein n=1 Tax=Nannocystis sp. TaxID=1962667 RepID=UPI0025EA17DB|nr:hypothetical protein [Nannocystis sp.]MBK7829705.1 hypothetical protein [Nannocystis sp.]